MRLWAYAFPVFFVGLGVAFGVLAYLDEPPEASTTFWLIAGIFIGVGLLIAAIYALVGRSLARGRRLRRTGKQAWAVVTRVEDTGVTVNDNPRVHVWLKVKPERGREFEVDGKRVVSRIAIPTAGSSILIRYDPADPDGFVFDDGGSKAEGSDPAGLERMLRQALDAKGVTGALQDEAVEKTLAAAASGQAVIDLREYTQRDANSDGRVQEADPVAQLERLAKLRKDGVLTEGEFIVAKTKLLGEL